MNIKFSTFDQRQAIASSVTQLNDFPLSALKLSYTMNKQDVVDSLGFLTIISAPEISIRAAALNSQLIQYIQLNQLVFEDPSTCATFGDLTFFATNALLNLQDLTLDAPRLLVLSSSYSHELKTVVLVGMPDLQFFRMTCTQLL